MKPKLHLLHLVCLFVFLQVGGNKLFSQAPQWLDWETYQTVMEEEPKKAMIYIYTNWCGPCAKMDSSTFNDPGIKMALEADYYPVKFNAEDTPPLKFKGEIFNFVFSRRKGFHALAFHLAGQKLSYPCFILLDEKQVKTGNWFGYLDMVSMLHFLKFPDQSTESYPTMESWMGRLPDK